MKIDALFAAGEILPVHRGDLTAAPAARPPPALAHVPPPLQGGGSSQHSKQGTYCKVDLCAVDITFILLFLEIRKGSDLRKFRT